MLLPDSAERLQREGGDSADQEGEQLHLESDCRGSRFVPRAHREGQPDRCGDRIVIAAAKIGLSRPATLSDWLTAS
jgi:hypothetical protein